MQLSDKTIQRLKNMAECKVWSDCFDDDDFCIDDYAGGNQDDAFYGGQDSGKTELAREILTELGIEFNIEED